MSMEFTETSRYACLAARFPQLRTFWTRIEFKDAFSDQYMADFAKKYRIKELLAAIDAVEAGTAGPEVLDEFPQSKPTGQKTTQWAAIAAENGESK